MKTKQQILLLLIVLYSNLYAQNPLYDLDKKIRKGNFEALIEITNYFENKGDLTEFLGHHIIKTTYSNVAKRIVKENSLFLKSEFTIDSTTTKKKIHTFLLQNRGKIFFSKLANAFVIVPFKERNVNYKVIGLSQAKLKYLKDKKKKLLDMPFVKSLKIDSLIQQKNPIALLKIASLVLINRNRFNEYNFQQEEMIELIQLLITSKIVVEDEKKEMNYHIENDYGNQSKINLLTFFLKHYKNYKWNDNINAFSNKNISIKKVEIEIELFDNLNSKNDSIAINSFIALTKFDANKISKLSNDYTINDVSTNYALPTFPFRFLKQLSLLTEFCQENNIDYNGSKKLQSQITKLKSKLSFKERRFLEDEMINELNLNNITSFEYWALVNEKSWDLTFSSARILDKFYSRNWKKLLNDKKHLETYLLKSKLFNDIGIIGYCNEYLVKFSNSSKENVELIRKMKFNNPKVQNQLTKIQNLETKKKKKQKSWKENYNGDIKNLNRFYKDILTENLNKEDFEDKIVNLLSRVSYNQIGNAIKIIEQVEIEDKSNLYSFIKSDFGLFFVPKLSNKTNRKSFLKIYNKYSEFQLYEYYLKENGISFTSENGNLDFDKIFEILKYDLNYSFVGGGNNTKDNGVYSIIKLLEIKFNKTLGFSNKLCASDGWLECTARSRAIKWMKYLKKKKTLKKEHNEPVSFGVNK